MSWLGSAHVRVGLVLGLALGASGCKASNYIKAAEETRPKNAHAACEYLALALKEDPTNQKAIDELKEIGQKIAEEHAANVAELERSGRFAEAVAQCDRVIATRKLLTELPGNIDIFTNADDRTRLAKKASQKYLAEGKQFQAAGNAKKAAQAFCLAKGFDPANTEAATLYESSKAAATLRVAIARFSCNRQGTNLAQAVTDRFFDKMVEKKPQFLALSHEGEGQAQATLVGTIQAAYKDTGWVEKPGHRSERKSRVSKDADGNPRLDPGGNQIYEDYTAEAHWVLHERGTALDLTIGYQVKLADGTVKWAGTTSEHGGDHKKWVSDVHGDRDVLPEEIRELPKDPQEPRDFAGLSSGMVDPMVEKLTHELLVQQKR